VPPLAWLRNPYWLAALSGVLQVLIFPPFYLPYLAAVAVTPLLVALAREPSRRKQFFLGLIAGWIYWGGACYWIYGVMHEYAHLAAPAAGAIFVGFFLVKGLHLGVFALIAAPLMRRAWAIPAVAAAWVAVEGSHQYLGFTWLQLGNAGASMSVPARLAPYTGVYGLSFVFVMMNAAAALALLRRPRRQLAWLASAPLLFLLPGLQADERGETPVRLVQPNVHPGELILGGWSRARERKHLERMRELSLWRGDSPDAARPELLIWPEYPAPAYYFADPFFQSYIESLARESGSYLIFNAIAFTEDEDGERPLNSAVTLDPQGRFLSVYSKMFLVPFGEFVPWPFSLFIEKVTLEAGDFKAGEDVVVSPVGERKVGTFICYESVFARGVRRFVNRGAEVLVNISNDSWYGRTAARYQHLLIARMRAIENQRWLLRATNDGITAAINPAGQLTARLPSFRQGALSAWFNYRREMTWFARWGEWFWQLCVAATALMLVLSGLVQRRSTRS